ncbi:hypothetical protein F2Q69_00036641 [Brassica cretica]|uniref:Transmembrane protein n=1 Tax=Brassica cretica TaxID=69181 RepID=A0A8S9SFH7_BRACR|nr:hypothetical protein F2Q69_00036641 [Brassica cretica]
MMQGLSNKYLDLQDIPNRCIPFPRGMVQKSIILIKNGFVLYSSLLLIIFIILLCMNGVSGVCYHGGVVIVVLPIFWTTVDRFFWWEMSIDVAE